MPIVLRLRHLSPLFPSGLFALAFLLSWLGHEWGITQQVDVSISRAIQRFRTPEIDSFMIAITHGGSPPVLLAFAGILSIWAVVRSRIGDATIWLVSTTSAGLSMILLKILIHRDRPLEAFIAVMGFSYPSGHATMAAVFFGCAGWFLGRLPSPLWRSLTIALGAGSFALIGVSRVYLGVHWPTDVVGGFALGLFWASLSVHLFPRRTKRSEHSS